MTPVAAQSEIQSLESGGDFLLAYDRAQRAIAAFPAEAQFHYLAVRALARSGATRQALDLYQHYGLGRHDNVDYLALRARLEKDLALGSTGADRARCLRAAAQMYEEVFGRLGGYYPAINAATLFLLAGDVDRARSYAHEALAWCRRDANKGELDDYYRAASRAEAHLVLGQTLEAMQALHALASISRGDLAARATTRRQLRLILDAQRLNDSILDPLTPPEVIHYTGHMISAPGASSGLSSDAEPALAEEIAAAFARANIGIAYGSLACGSDILFAEECLRRKIELHLVFPFRLDDFKTVSVAPGGAGWVARFEAVLAGAASAAFATDSDDLGDDGVFGYCSELAMGKAILRGRYIDARVAQLAVWDGTLATGPAGAAADVARWRATGHESRVISVPRSAAKKRRGDVSVTRAGNAVPGALRRELRALIFGDTVGFSQLPERMLPRYRKTFLGTVADAVRSFGADVLSANSWGDALYLVMADAAAGARCALDIQRRLGEIDFRAFGFAQPLELRLSIHYGPVFPGTDELTAAPTYYGKQVTFAARMEPVTPPREVYATEAVAAQLALARVPGITADYVGRVALAKRFGTAPMYMLRGADGGSGR